MTIPFHHEFIHHQNPSIGESVREFVFGMEDSMVAVLGSITGIAGASRGQGTIILAGLTFVAVESISMAVGSYLANKSERSVNERKLHEERTELISYPNEEKQELIGMYVADGWPKTLAANMAEEASKNHELFLREMAYRELKIVPENLGTPFKNALIMLISCIIGGIIPIIPYILLAPHQAIFWSIAVTLIGLFVVGVAASKYSRRTWWIAGLEMLILASAAAIIGYMVGQGVDRWLGK